WLGRGNADYGRKRYADAAAAYDKAIALAPDLASAWLGRGNISSDLQRFEEALAAYGTALSHEPDLAKAYGSRGLLRHQMLDVEAALADYEKAIAIAPADAEVLFQKSLTLLLAGNLEEGWPLYEWRWKTRQMRGSQRTFAQPLWLGQEPVAGKTVLIHDEQGLGDTIQFCRYAKAVADLGAKVVFDVRKPLVELFRSLAGVTEVVERGKPLPPFDFHCPVMSLPLAFKTTLATIPNEVPYLRSDPEKSRAWRDRLGARGKPRVGLVWAGGFHANGPEVWRVNERKKIDLAQLAVLRDVDATFVSLQKGEAAEAELAALVQKNWGGPAIADFTSELTDFSDTAALIDNLDLVVAVDTSVAHLAGAMGKPVWILNRFDSDWRYFLERTDSP